MTTQSLINEVNAELLAMGLSPVNQEEIDCLTDPTRADEALDMVDDWSDRLGLSDYLRGELATFITDSFYTHQRG